MNNTEIGECMKQLRENAGLSAKDVSRLLFDKYGIEMNHRTLFNYEKGRSSPDLVRFLALCEIYNCRDFLSLMRQKPKSHNTVGICIDKLSLGCKLRDMRIASKLKWDEIISKMHNDHGIQIARSTIYGYEHGSHYPDPNILFALLIVYDRMDDLQALAFGEKAISEPCKSEEIILYESEFSPDEWVQLKGYINYIIANHKSK